MTVKLHLAREEVEAVVDTVACASVVEKRLACKLGIWKKARKVKVRQGDRRCLEGNFVVDTSFKIMDFCSVVCKFGLDTEVLDIWNRDII